MHRPRQCNSMTSGNNTMGRKMGKPIWSSSGDVKTSAMRCSINNFTSDLPRASGLDLMPMVAAALSARKRSDLKGPALKTVALR